MQNKINNYATLSEIFNEDQKMVNWHDETLWFVRKRRDKVVQGIPEWEQLREYGSRIKNHALSDLDYYVTKFEKNANANGINVDRAAVVKEHNEIILEIIRKNNIKHVVKNKSMLTEECNLNSCLAVQDIEVIDTDLGEYIVPLRNKHPCHIVLPAIHLKNEDVSTTFHKRLNTKNGNNDPQYLAEASRQHLRSKFIFSGLAITGLNFTVAETMGFVVCTNEGNAPMGVHAAGIHIACMGIALCLNYNKSFSLIKK